MLNQEIPNHKLNEQSKHKLKINKEFFLYEVYGTDLIEVNSYHRQCVKDVAKNFKITAMSEDVIIEGIEKDNIIAIQWHPEVLYDMKFFKRFN